MKTTIENVRFTFPGVCASCLQHLADNGEENTYTKQDLSLSDVLDSGCPLCPECDAELQPEDQCDVIPTEGEKEIMSKIEESCGGSWGEHKECPRVGWRVEVANNDTNLGYWEWVAHQMEVVND